MVHDLKVPPPVGFLPGLRRSARVLYGLEDDRVKLVAALEHAVDGSRPPPVAGR